MRAWARTHQRWHASRGCRPCLTAGGCCKAEMPSRSCAARMVNHTLNRACSPVPAPAMAGWVSRASRRRLSTRCVCLQVGARLRAAHPRPASRGGHLAAPRVRGHHAGILPPVPQAVRGASATVGIYSYAPPCVLRLMAEQLASNSNSAAAVDLTLGPANSAALRPPHVQASRVHRSSGLGHYTGDCGGRTGGISKGWRLFKILFDVNSSDCTIRKEGCANALALSSF